MSKHPDMNLSMQRISDLSAALAEHFLQMVQTDGKIHTFDFFVAGAADRAISISRAFRSMLGEKNYVVSAILLRAQIDTYFRVFGITLVDDPLKFCEKIFEGARYDTLVDRNGKKLKDFHLKAEVGKIYSWVPTVYENSSGFVHMSSKNIFTVFDQGVIAEDGYNVNVSIGHGGSHLSDEPFMEIAAAFAHVMQICLDTLQAIQVHRPIARQQA